MSWGEVLSLAVSWRAKRLADAARPVKCQSASAVLARSGRCKPDPARTPPVSACRAPNSVLVCAAQSCKRGQDEELSRRRRGDPRGVSQAQDRLHHVLAGLGMVAHLGGARAPEARQQGRPDLRRVLARDARGQHGRRLHADDRAAAGGAAARRRRRAAGKHGHPRRHAERGAHGGHVGRIPNARRRPRPRHRGAVVWRPHRRWHRALRRTGCEMGARRDQPPYAL